MDIKINPHGFWYHGSNKILSEAGSTITQWKALAKAFSHKPSELYYDDDGDIEHNGIEKGYLYIVDEPVKIEADIYQHPTSTMDKNAEFLTKRPLALKLAAEL